MAKLTRKNMKLFAESAASDEIGIFGSKAAASPATSDDPDDIQSLSQYLDGWYAAVINGNSPCIEDMNALFYLIAYQLVYSFQEGVAEWNSATTYYIGSLVNDFATGNGLFYSIADDNLNHATTDLTKWKLVPGITGAIQSKSGAYDMINDDSIVLANGTFTVNLPAASTNARSKYIVKNVGTGVITVATPGSETIDGQNTFVLSEQYQFIEVMCDGTNYHIIGW